MSRNYSGGSNWIAKISPLSRYGPRLQRKARTAALALFFEPQFFDSAALRTQSFSCASLNTPLEMRDVFLPSECKVAR